MQRQRQLIQWVKETIPGLEEKNEWKESVITFESRFQRETLNPEPISLGNTMLVKLGKTIEKAVFVSCNLGKWVAGITLGLAMLLTTADVVWRYFFNHSIVAAHDVTELMMVVVVFLGLAYTASVKGHIRVNVVLSRLSERARAILDSITAIFSIAIFAVMAWRLGMHAWHSIIRGESTPTVRIPIGPFLSLAAVGCAMLCAQLLVQLYISLARAARKQ